MNARHSETTGALRSLKYQTALSVAYGAGLRASEATSLKVSDVDSQRMTLRVEQGKGSKDRCRRAQCYDTAQWPTGP